MNFMANSLENDKKNLSDKVTTLNPNAAEFVPSAFRCTNGNTICADYSRTYSTGSSGKAILGRSESSISNNSDDESHQYWHRQLPDDITPDFKAMRENEIPDLGQLSLAGLSISDIVEPSRLSGPVNSGTFGIRKGRSLLGANNLAWSRNIPYSGSPYTEDQPPAAHIASSTNSRDRLFVNGDQRLTRGMKGEHYNGDSNAGCVNNMLGDPAVIEDAAIDPLDFLSSQFPGVAAHSLADFYLANGCDLDSTVEMLGQLQGDGDFGKNLSARSWSVPSLSKLAMPAHPVAESQVPYGYRSTSSVFRGSTDFAYPARKFSNLDISNWKHERNCSADGSIGSSGSSQFLASSYNRHGNLLYADKSPSPVSSRETPVWLETGEALENMHSETRKEARDLARLRDAFLEQSVEKLGEGKLVGPEDVWVGAGGVVYTATRDGWIKRLLPNRSSEEWRFVGGPAVLGVTGSADGNILACDVHKGLLKVGEGGVTVLASRVDDDGSIIRFADEAIESSDGSVYFSDASSKFGLHDWFLDNLEARPHGRLLKYDPSTGKTTVVLSNLAFANGVALSPDEDFLLVCETWRFRCLKHWLRGELKGETGIFIDNLPGGPDNIHLAPDGSFWIALLKLKSGGWLDLIHRSPVAKRVIAAFPKLVGIANPVKKGAMAVKVAANGSMIRAVDDRDGKVMSFVTSAVEFEGHLYLGSLATDFIGKLPL